MKKITILSILCAVTLSTFSQNIFNTKEDTTNNNRNSNLEINAKEQMNKIENNYETVANDPLKARIYTLNNGLKVYLTAYADAPRMQTNIVVCAGSKNDPADATGLAHYLYHMLFK